MKVSRTNKIYACLRIILFPFCFKVVVVLNEDFVVFVCLHYLSCTRNTVLFKVFNTQKKGQATL